MICKQIQESRNKIKKIDFGLFKQQDIITKALLIKTKKPPAEKQNNVFQYQIDITKISNNDVDRLSSHYDTPRLPNEEMIDKREYKK